MAEGACGGIFCYFGTPVSANIKSLIVQEESEWQEAPNHIRGVAATTPGCVLTRWSGSAGWGSLDLSSDYSGSHFVTYSLQSVEERYWIGSKSLTNGVILPDSIFLQGPTSRRRRALVSGAFDFFRVYFPNEIVVESLEFLGQRGLIPDVVLFEAQFVDDQIIRDLMRSLLTVEGHDDFLGPTFIDGVCLALAFHLTRYCYRNHRISTHGPTRSALQKWRLIRVVEYIETHLHQPIYLAELSAAAGLSRMHFAAQFRKATGYTPHGFVTKQRVARAQELLIDGKLSLSDVAAAVGFSTQAHFSAVFKKLVGNSPAQWRSCILT
jgi:AraC family transcriptional regulator